LPLSNERKYIPEGLERRGEESRADFPPFSYFDFPLDFWKIMLPLQQGSQKMAYPLKAYSEKGMGFSIFGGLQRQYFPRVF